MEQKNTQGAAPDGKGQGMTIDQAVAAAYQHWNAGQGAQAEQLCQQVLKAWPEHAGALHLMGLLAFTAGNRPLAIEYVKRACNAPSAPALFYSNLAEMLRQDGKPTDAERAARRALALDSQLPAAWTNLGIVLQEIGKLDESLDCLNRALARNPQSPENHNNLANTLKRMGRLTEARAQYEAALKLRPNYAEAHNNLAFLLNSLGEIDQAEVEIRRAIEINPHYIDAYINAAAIAMAKKMPDEALRWLDNLSSFAPDHPGGLVARARALLECDREKEALEAASRALAASPENGEAAATVAEALARLGRCDEALAAFDKAATLPSPQPANAIIGKAALLGELGRKEEAEATFAKAAEVAPHSARALFNVSSIRKYKRGDPEIEQMEKLLANGEVEERDDKMMLHFALGKVWMDVGDGPRAFAHLAEGCRIKRATYAYDGAATARWMESVAETFTPDMMKRFEGAGDPSDVPLFIVGMPRSGTTLVEQILAAHPAVHGAGELKTMQQIADHAVAGAAFPEWLNRVKPEDMAKLGRTYLDQVRPKAPEATRITDKMPANFFYAGLIRLMLPNARIVHCRRDPVDTCLSCYSKLFAGEQRFSYDLKELGEFYRAYEKLTAYWRMILPPDRFMEVQYEEVVENLEKEARRLVAFAGLEWDRACLEYYKNKRQIRTASFEQVRQPIYRTSVGRWKKFAKELRPLLEVLGVEAS